MKELKIPQSDHLISVIQNYLLDGILDSKDKGEIERILEKNGGEDNMLNCVRVINEENARLVRQGRREGKKEAINSMIKKFYNMKFPLEKIAQAAELDIEEVKKILEIKD